MIEVDVFWSFGIGAACACACAQQLSREEYSSSAFANKYFAYTVVVLSCVFSPSGIYLLMAYPGWESMFLLNRDIVNSYPMLITTFNCTNTLLGVIGFYCVWSSIQNSKNASTQDWIVNIQRFWIYPYIIMFAILGFGYHRFLYPSTYDEFSQNVSYSLFSFFTCNVFFTLLEMGVILIPLLYYPWYQWSQFNSLQLSKIRSFILKEVFFLLCIICLGYVAFIHGYCDQEMQNYFQDERMQFAGIYAPMVAFVVAINSLFLLAIIPVYTITAVRADKAKGM